MPYGDDYNIYNNLTGTIPCIIHANGPSKVIFHLTKYLLIYFQTFSSK